MRIFLRSFKTLSVIALTGTLTTQAAIINDGSTTDNLGRLRNAFGTDTAVTTANVVDGAISVAQSPQGFPIPPLRTAWYSTSQVPSGGVYTVSAEFTPAMAADERRGGVIGWLDKTAGVGIGLHIRPGGFSGGIRLNTINFLAQAANDNEALTGLFNLDGTEATGDNESAHIALPENYDPTQPAIFELSFSAPSDSEKADLADATAKVIARILQSDGTENQQLGESIELLTTLPTPDPLAHRVGYYAYWGSIFFEGNTIGTLDNLSVEGEFQEPPPNTLPTASIKAPAEGLNQEPPASYTLEVDAVDADGTIDLVEVILVETGELLAQFSEAPYTFQWDNVPSGNYNIIARATDNCGGSAESEAITLSVNRAPRVAITSPSASAVFELPVTIELSANVSDLDGNVTSLTWVSNGSEEIATVDAAPFSYSWVNPPAGLHILTARVTDDLGGTGESRTATITVNEGAGPVEPTEPPTLGIALSDGQIAISWPADSGNFVLEGTNDLITWEALAEQANPFLVTPGTEDAHRYYRLQEAN